MIRRRLILVVFVVLLAGCSGLPDDVRLGPYPACDTTWTPPAPSSRGRLLLMAQSVPDTSMIPCLGELPPGWEFIAVSVDSSGSRLTVETDTFDLDVGISLVETCDASGADETISNEPEARLYVSDDRQTLTYTFDGGCVLIEFPTAKLAASPEGRALVAEIHLMPRDHLRTVSGWEL